MLIFGIKYAHIIYSRMIFFFVSSFNLFYLKASYQIQISISIPILVPIKQQRRKSNEIKSKQNNWAT